MKAKQLLQMDIDVLRASVNGRATEGWDVVGQLKQSVSPTLLLTANEELGGVMTTAWTARCVSLLSNCKTEKWDDSGHGMPSACSFPLDDILEEWASAGLRQRSALRSYFGMVMLKSVRAIGHLSARSWEGVQAWLRIAF